MSTAARISAVVFTIGATALLTACSQTTRGAATPDSSSVASASPGSNAARPLNPEPYRDKPCDLLPAELPASLGYPQPGTPDTTSQAATVITGQSCSWLAPASSKTIQVQVLLENRDAGAPGLAHTFSEHDKGLIAYADPTSVSGYEAAFADLTDERARGNCALLVSVSSTETVVARASGYSGAQDSCDTAKQLAEAMVKTLQGGS
jgi:hypothetical protein